MGGENDQGNGSAFLLFSCLLLFFQLKFWNLRWRSTVVRSNTDRSHVPFPQYFPMLTLDKAVVQFHSQDADMDTVKVQNVFINRSIRFVALCGYIYISSPIPDLWPPLVYSCFYNFVISRMRDQGSHVVCDHFGFIFFLSSLPP